MSTALKRHITDSPPCKHAKVFRYCEATWKAHPFLARWVKTWASWTGGPEDAQDPDCTAGIWVRLTPRNEPPEPDTERTTDAPLSIMVEILVPGTCAEDLMDVWAAFVAACYPGDDSFLQGLDAAGGYGYALRLGPYGQAIADDASSPVNLAGVGFFACYVNLDTPV